MSPPPLPAKRQRLKRVQRLPSLSSMLLHQQKKGGGKGGRGIPGMWMLLGKGKKTWCGSRDAPHAGGDFILILNGTV